MDSDFLTAASLILGILGLVATLWGTYLTYISFVNPIHRFNHYLKNKEGWEKFSGIEDNLSIYRYKKYPGFQIIIDWSKELVDNFYEEWINDNLYPDKTNNFSCYVQFVANGMLLDKEVFVSLDGHRYFVPLPRTTIADIKTEDRSFYYDNRQIQLANIIGIYHFGDMNIYEFAKKQKRPIRVIVENLDNIINFGKK